MPAEPSTLSVGLAVASSMLGLVASGLLMVSAWRAIPYNKTIYAADEINPGGLLGEEAMKDSDAAKKQLSRVMSLEPRFLAGGAFCLLLSFLSGLISHWV